MALDFEAINQSALAGYDRLLKQWFPLGRKAGQEFLIGNINGEKGDSLSINIKTGAWCDFAGNLKGGDPVSLYAALRNIDRIEAARQLGAMLGVAEVGAPPPQEERKTEDEPPLEYPPEDAPEHPKKFKNLTFSQSWEYRDAQGKRLGYVIRFNAPDGGKETIPCRWIGGKWKFKSFPKPRPLYNLDDLYRRPDAPVAIGEGEKTADALKMYLPTYVAVTWPGGTKAVEHTDWAPLAKRKIVIFPDADGVGVEAANKIAEKLALLGCENIIMLDTREMPEGWDAADAMRDGWTIPQFIAWAKPRMHIMKEVDSAGKTKPQPMSPVVEASAKMQPDLPPDEAEEDYAKKKAAQGRAEAGMQNYFKILGFNDDKFYFYVRASSSVKEMTASQLSQKANLFTLAPDDAWKLHKNKSDYGAAVNYLVQTAYQIGMYDPSAVRGIGAWHDAGRNVLHLGRFLLVNGERVEISDFRSNYVYQQKPSINMNTSPVELSNQEAVKLVRICDRIRWTDPMGGKLLAGWIFSSIVCGAVSWRSHIYIVGPAGSGKSWIMDNIVGRVLEGYALKCQSKSSEAGIRQDLGADARPVIFDEAETDNGQVDQARMEAVFALARQASSGGAPIVKGSAGHNAVSYNIRSSFCFSSIKASIEHYADESRITELALRAPSDQGSAAQVEEQANFLFTEQMVHETLTEEWRSALFTRAIKLMPVIIQNQKVFMRVGAKIFGGQRQADQMSMMLAGLFALHQSTPVTDEAAVAWLEKQNWSFLKNNKVDKTEERLIHALLQRQMDITLHNNKHTTSIGEMISLLREPRQIFHSEQNNDDAKREIYATMLGLHGIKVDGENNFLYISTNAEGIKRILKNTPWSTRWHQILVNIKGVNKDLKQIRFNSSMSGKAVAIPMNVLFNEEP